MTDTISDDRDRLIHILVVHFDMFRDKAEEAADLFLHHKILASRHQEPVKEPAEWQEISTAPKDGSEIMLICATAYTPTAFEGWWDEGWKHYSRDGSHGEKFSGNGVTEWFPTHWRPKPEWLPLRAASIPKEPGVRVKPLTWSVSEVFGKHKVRGYGILGEFCSFTLDGLSDAELAEKKARYQADYEQRILSAIEPTPIAPVPVTITPTHRHKKRGTEYVLIGIGKMKAEDWCDEQLMEIGPDGVVGDRGSVDMREVAIYRSATDPTEIWVRPREEFEDGRFAALSAKPTGEE